MSGQTITWIVVVIIVLACGYWWYTSQGAPVEPPVTETSATVPAQ